MTQLQGHPDREPLTTRNQEEKNSDRLNNTEPLITIASEAWWGPEPLRMW